MQLPLSLRKFLIAFAPAMCVAAVIVYRGWPSIQPTPTWTYASRQPTPVDFRYLGFPKSSAASLLDASRQKVVEPLKQAVIISQDEMLASDFIGVRTADGPRHVASSDVTFVIDRASADVLVDALARSREMITSEDCSRTKMEIRGGDSLVWYVVLTLGGDDDYTVYEYGASTEGVVPYTMTVWNGKRIAFKTASIFFWAVVGGAIVFVVFYWRFSAKISHKAIPKS